MLRCVAQSCTAVLVFVGVYAGEGEEGVIAWSSERGLQSAPATPRRLPVIPVVLPHDDMVLLCRCAAGRSVWMGWKL